MKLYRPFDVRRLGASLAALAMVFAVPAPVAFAAPGDADWEIALQRVSAPSVPSGSMVNYLLSVQCAALESPECTNGVITVLLPQHVDQDQIVLAAHPYVQSWSAEDSKLVIVLRPSFPAGGAVQLDLGVGTVNYTTPDGTIVDLIATIDADNTPAVSATDAVTLTASSAIAVKKTLPGRLPNGSVFRKDTDITYSVSACATGGTGSGGLGRLGLASGTLADTLPASAVFVAASGAGAHDPATNTVTWPFDGDAGAECFSASVTVKYLSTDLTVPANVTNTVTFAGRAIGQASDFTGSASVNHKFGAPALAGDFCKTAASAVAYSSAAATCDSTTAVPTYAGEWNGGIASRMTATQATADLSGVSAEASFLLRAQSSMTTEPTVGGIVDPVPCLTNSDGAAPATYSSNAPGVLCTDPAFVVTGVRTTGLQASNPTRLAATAGDAPSYVTTAGVVKKMTLVSNSAAVLTGGAWFAPAAGDRVSEVRWQDVNIAGAPQADQRMHAIRVYGYLSTSLNTGDQVANRARLQIQSGDGGAASTLTSWQRANMVVVDGVIARISKSMGTTARYSISASVTSPTMGDTWSGGLVITDLLPVELQDSTLASALYWPPGMTTSAALSNTQYRVEKVPDYNGTGRTLLRITVPPGVRFNANYSVLFSLDVPTQYPWYGSRTNEARVHVPGYTIERCGDSTFRANLAVGNADTDDWDGNGLTTGDNFCTNSVALDRSASSVGFEVRKEVKGNLDDTFAAYPKVALTDPSLPGNASYRISVRNSGGVALRNVVAYDVLPRVGDTGVSSVLSTRARGSAFRPTMGGAVTVATTGNGVWQVAYSTNANPCRPEMPVATNPSWPAGCVNDWSATAPTNLDDVTALRFTMTSGLLAATTTTSDKATFTWSMKTPAAATPGQVAWNTVGVSAVNNVSSTKLLTSEPPKVGLAVPLTDVELAKGVDKPAVAVGETVTYTVTAKHGTTLRDNGDGSFDYVDGSDTPTGAVAPATGVKVTDVLPTGLELVPGSVVAQQGSFDAATGVWSVGTIDVGGSTTLTYRAKVTAAGPHVNTAQVTADGVEDVDSVPDNCATVTTEDDCASATVNTLTPGIKLTKLVESAPGSGTYLDANEGTSEHGTYPSGAGINYRFLVENTGDVPLKDVTITDPKIPFFCDTQFAVGVIPAGESRTVDCRLPIGFSVGTTVNIASVTGTTPGDTALTAADTAQVLVPTPAITVEKETNGEAAQLAADAVVLGLGDTVTWTYVVRNTGTDALTQLALADDQESGVALNDEDCTRSAGTWGDPLQPGDSIRCSFTGMAEYGLYANTATATGKGAVSPFKVTGTDTSHYLVPLPEPSVSVLKSTNGVSGTLPADRVVVIEGSPVTWTYVLTNDGDDALTDLTLGDDKELAVTLDEDDCVRSTGTWGAPLPTGATITCMFTGEAGATDYVNTATVGGTGVVSDTNVDDTDVSGYKAEPLAPALTLDKRTNGLDAATPETAVPLTRGGAVSWSYVIANTGNEAVTDLELTDDKESAVKLEESACVRSAGAWSVPLQPGQTITCGHSGTANQAAYVNVATVTGRGVGTGTDVGDDDTSHYTSTPLPVTDSTAGGGTHQTPAPVKPDSGMDPNGDNSGVGDKADGPLAMTGSNSVPVMMVAMVMFVAGVVLRVGSRRRRPAGVAATTE